MTPDQDDLRDQIPIVSANCPAAVRQALETALRGEKELRYQGDLTLDLNSSEGYGVALSQLSTVMSEGVLILILYVTESPFRLPRLFSHLLEANAGLRILVISGSPTASSITAYWMSLRWRKLPAKDSDDLSGALLNGIWFVTKLDPSQDDDQSPVLQ